MFRRIILCIALMAVAVDLREVTAQQSQGAASSAQIATSRNESQPTDATNHPLQPVLALARSSLNACDSIQDYSCTFVKREHLDGAEKLGNYDYVFMKIRHKPFSVYCYSLGPEQPKGQEALFVEGRNNNRVIAHTVGLRNQLVGSVTLDPTSPYMMEGNRYPITSAGMKNLLLQTIPIFEEELRYGEVDVRLVNNAKVDGRTCICAQVSHPVKRPHFRASLMRMYFDGESKLPIRWEAYDWPKSPGAPPPLIEEYTYRDLRLNQNLAEIDFDPQNKDYGF